MTKKIPVGIDGKIALVDDEDYGLLARHNWRLNGPKTHRYAIANIGGKQILMHRLILNTPNALETYRLRLESTK